MHAGMCVREMARTKIARGSGQIQLEIGSHAHAILGVKDGKVVGSRDARRVSRSALLQS